MAKTVTKLGCCGASVTSVTKRNKRNISTLDSKRNNVTTPPVGGLLCYACPGSVQKPPDELLDVLAIATAAKQLARDFQLLKNEVLTYCNTYISRGYHAEGVALVRLRKAAER
jgi:hypothetical protein